ncbi:MULTISPECIES: AlpA family transcriptional regulator [Thioalkalivibrio]|uniref:AlpA family transcriptional regulator n=1 Tax=Thioalkalivibrio versutus TaxID=106634 RepID=A0A0G3G4R0_9GAMM|nr:MULTISPECIES: AlpA family phage regulatory protein [Thioalkalivibrio]AKJ95364.1 hypothetical protein TVD_08325 [Thioalkalivibrio versutus]
MDTKQIDTLITIRDVCDMTRLSRASIYRLLQRDAFPAPRRISARCVRWRLSSIERWIDKLPANQDAE